ncbi:ABC transporter ATP-binding protein [Vineibacter terrae]|uniref:ABC transporter ATP-binding protein n=1 Tax=Vineibacter terrae TaxID=2586908 RepID=A0A5C8PC40_9HYPH|nr:ABC transporter ATP-binding protein [Vineibacter terrae]TXL71364.1 ABC transporter ATP-binding protein [Vineibacter terrae]
MTDHLLEIQGLSVQFGGVTALSGVDLLVRPQSVHGLIGPNGAGKTTLLNCITRLVRPTAGSIRLAGADLLAAPPHAIAGMGIARTFQNFGLIGELSVLENVMAGMHARHPGGLLEEMLLLGRRNRHERQARARALESLAFTGLSDVADRLVASLPYGMRKAVELARAIAIDPRLLLLDEPTAGLNEAEMERLRRTLRELQRSTDVTILLITHHVEFLLGIADAVTVLDLGRRIAFGDPSLVKTDPQVVAAYIGTEA